MTGVSESNQADQVVYERPTDELRQVVAKIDVDEWPKDMGWLAIGHKVKRDQQIVVNVQRKWLVRPGLYPRGVGPPDIYWDTASFEWRDLPTVNDSRQ